MRKFIAVVAGVFVFLWAPMASSVPMTYEIKVDGIWTETDPGPFGLPFPLVPSVFTALVTVDSELAGMARLTDFLMTTGNKAWTEDLLLASQSELVFNATALAGFQLTFQDGLDILMLTYPRVGSLMYLLDDGGPSLNCLQCVALASVSDQAVPVPNTLALLLGAGLACAGLRRRAADA